MLPDLIIQQGKRPKIKIKNKKNLMLYELCYVYTHFLEYCANTYPFIIGLGMNPTSTRAHIASNSEWVNVDTVS